MKVGLDETREVRTNMMRSNSKKNMLMLEPGHNQEIRTDPRDVGIPFTVGHQPNMFQAHPPLPGPDHACQSFPIGE